MSAMVSGRDRARSLSRTDFKGTVGRIWRANAAGQYLPSDVLPGFDAADLTRRSTSLPCRSISMTMTRRSSRLAHMAWRRSTPAAVGSPCCAKSRSARILGSTGSIRSMCDYYRP